MKQRRWSIVTPRARRVGPLGIAAGGILTAIACSSGTDGNGGVLDGGSETIDSGGAGGAAGSPSGGSGGLGAGPSIDGSLEAATDGSAGDAGSGAFVCQPDPRNFDVPGNGCDDDADGTTDNTPACDTGLAVDGDAFAFAKALGVCRNADATHWGLVGAAYASGTSLDAPNPGQHGILPGYGAIVKPTEGKALGVLGTGYARDYNTPSGRGTGQGPDGGLFGQSASWHSNDPFTGMPKDLPGKLPPGFPAPSGNCPTDPTVYNAASVKLVIQVPRNARALAVDFDFHTSEWPVYVCSRYNDGYLTYLKTSAVGAGAAGSNISFDSTGKSITVNNDFFDRCTPHGWVNCEPTAGPAGAVYGPGKSQMDCAAGVAELAGTGYGGSLPQCTKTPTESLGGATGWLTSKASVVPGETIELAFMIWNTGDENLDSSVLVDHLRWETAPVTTETTRP